MVNIKLNLDKDKIKVFVNDKKVRWGEELSYLITGLHFEGRPKGICELHQNPIAGEINFKGNTYNFMLPVLNMSLSKQEFKDSFLKRKEVADGIKEWLRGLKKIETIKINNQFNIFNFIKGFFKNETRF